MRNSRSALRIDPDLAEAHYNLGVALSDIPGRLPAAIAEYEAAIRFRPGYAEAHNNLGFILREIPQRLPDAIAEFETVLRIDPGSVAPRTHNLRSRAVEDTGADALKPSRISGNSAAISPDAAPGAAKCWSACELHPAKRGDRFYDWLTIFIS